MACRTCFREVSVDAGQKRPSGEGEFPSVMKDAATEAGKPVWGSTRQMRVVGVCVFLRSPCNRKAPCPVDLEDGASECGVLWFLLPPCLSLGPLPPGCLHSSVTRPWGGGVPE